MPEGNGDGVRRHFSYANVMSTLAVFLVLAGGTAMAAAVESSKDIAKQSVKNSDIKKNQIKSNRLKDGKAVQDVDVVPESLTGASILNGSIGTDDLADNSVTEPKIAANSVGTSEIQTDGVGEVELAADSVSADELRTITQRSATSANIPGGGNGSVTASCLPGEQVLSGGNDGFFDVFVVASRQSGNGWAVFAHNDSGANRTITAHVYCLAA